MEIQLTIAMNFISSINNNEEHVVPLKIDIKIIWNQ